MRLGIGVGRGGNVRNDGRRVLITGGSKGIGRALALELARRGANVAIAARGQAAIDETLEAIRAVAPDRRAVGVAFDVTDAKAASDGVLRAVAELGGLDLLVCNSGAAQPGYAHELDASVYEDMIRLNYLGHVHCVLPLLPHFRRAKSGRIVLVSSMLGFMGLYGYTAYAASKFAIAGFGQALRQELGTVGVGVSICYPPTTRTPGLDAENATKPKDVWQLEADNSFSKTYSAEDVAVALADGEARGRAEIVVGMDSSFILWMSRTFPGLTRWLADKELDAARTKAGTRG